MTKTKAFMVVAALAGGGVATYRWQSSDAPARQAKPAAESVLKDRFWVDHMPRDQRDMFHVFLMFKDRPIGAFQHRSGWAGNFEGFRYEKKGDEVRALFPQSGSRESMKIKVTECKEGGMDYCLDLAGSSHGVKRYYSREDWVIRNPSDIEHLLSTLP